MARLIVDGADLVVGLSWLEKLGALRGDVRVPLSTVRSAELEPHPFAALRGSASGPGSPGSSPSAPGASRTAKTSPPWWAASRRSAST